MGEKQLLKVNAIFSDGMILQRDKEVPVWGSGGTQGQTITLSFGGKTVKAAVVEGGSWKAVFPPTEAGGPYELTIASGDQQIVIRDVLFGDLWLAGGQSNMEWRMRDTTGGQQEIAAADYPLLRYYDVPKVAYADGLEHSAAWKPFTSANVPEFSGVAYFFARKLQETQQIPIGIIGCNWGGTSASCWLDEQYMADDPGLKIYLDEFAASAKDFDWAAFEIEDRRYKKEVAEFERRYQAGESMSQIGDYPWPPPFSPRWFKRPSGLYHHMVQQVVPYALKGFIFYQGEDDSVKPMLYDRLLEALIHNWRRDWSDPALPFLFVQLTSFNWEDKPNGTAWPLTRESQSMVEERVPHTGMAVILDCGEKNDIHPRDKKPVGERLALIAKEKVYGESVESSGPRFRDLQVDGAAIKLRFDHAGEGLSAREGKLIGFEIAGADGAAAPAQTSIEGDAIVLWSDKVPSPVAVWYGWSNYSEANLINSAGLPASPFRTHRENRA